MVDGDDFLIESHKRFPKVIKFLLTGMANLVQEDYPNAKRITLVMDNLNTHTGASLYKAFAPDVARALLNS